MYNKTMNKCTTLHWSYRDLKHIPSDLIYYDETLEEIYLKENFITQIPAWLFQLTNLKFIHLTGNSISSIPDDIYLLENLEFLDISNNLLDKIPDTIGLLKNLERLNLGGNMIWTVPKSIGKLKKLEFLDLSENPIKLLPVEISECSRLVELLINGLAELLYIPDRIANMRTLQTLCADRCGLLYLPASTSKFIAHVRMFNNLHVTHIPMIYAKHFSNFYQQVHNIARAVVNPYLFLVREKETNSLLLLPFGTRKVFPVPSNENAITLYDHALHSINYINHFIPIFKLIDFLNTLPTVAMKNNIKSGPISMCNFCAKLLYTSYYLMVVKRLNSTSKTIFTCNFCSMFCSNTWMNENKTKYYSIEWEVCDN